MTSLINSRYLYSYDTEFELYNGPSIGTHEQLDMTRTSYNLTQEDMATDASSVRADVRVLAYKETVPTPEAGYQNNLRILYSRNNESERLTSIPTRPLPLSPEKTLNAPDLRNDY